MLKRTLVILVFLLTAAGGHAAIIANPEEVRPVPVIPRGSDWVVASLPELKVEQAMLSAEEVKQLLPRFIELGRIEESVTLGRPPVREYSPVQSLLAILAGILLLLAAYDFIPRAHSRVLRFRSLDLDRDLFT